MKRVLGLVIRLTLVVALLASAGIVTAPEAGRASAVGCAQPWWPNSGSIATYQDGDNINMATFSFVLTSDELDHLKCVAPYLEIDFHLHGFLVPPQWDGYTVVGTNLPGAIHDVAASDFNPLDSTPGVTRVYVNQLLANKTYTVTIAWPGASLPYPLNASPAPWMTPSIFMVFVPSHWAEKWDEQIVCNAMRVLGQFGDAWCIFPYPEGDQDASAWYQTRMLNIPGGLIAFNGHVNIFRFGSWAASTQLPTALDVPYLSMSFHPLPLAIPIRLLTALQPVSVWPSGTIAKYQPIKLTYRVKNTSGGAVPVQRFVVAVRGPSGDALDVLCNNGVGVMLQANQEFYCEAVLPGGYGSEGDFYYWPDWLGQDGAWHHGEIGAGGAFHIGAANTLSMAQLISVGPSAHVSMFTPLTWSYRVRNTSGAAASIKKFAVAVRAPDGSNQDVMCANGTGVTLQPGEEWTCSATLPTGYGSQGTFTFWPDWQGWDGSWHQGQLGWSNTLVQGPAVTTTVTQALSQSPNSTVPVYVPLDFSFKFRNTSGGEVSIQRIAVAVRGPAGDNLDVMCDNGYSVALPANAEFACHASAPTGYGSTGTYTYWADWQGWDGSWHHGALSGDQHFTLTGIQTLYPIQGIQVLPTNYEPKLSPLSWTYTVHNSSNGVANIKTFLVAVIGPAGDGLNVPCQGGTDVTIPAHGNWTCTANLPSGYGSTGQFRYRADWQGYDGAWHTGMLGAQYILTVY